MIDELKGIYLKIRRAASHLDLNDIAPGMHSIQLVINSEKDAELKMNGSEDTLDELLKRLELTEREPPKAATHKRPDKDRMDALHPRLALDGEYFVNRGTAAMHGVTKWTYYIDNVGHSMSEKIREGVLEIERKHQNYLLEKPSVWHRLYDGEKTPKLKSNKRF